MRRTILCAVALAWAPGAVAADGVEALGALPRLALEEAVTVSGLSSGAFFAHQFHVAFSDVVEGAAIIAGGPYACADHVPAALWANPTPQIATALAVCTHSARDAFGGWGLFLPGGPDADDSEDAVDDAWRAGDIADPDHLGDDRVFLLHGGRDDIVPEASMDAVEELYRHLAVRGDRLMVERLRDAGHGFPVEDVEESGFDALACGATARPYLIDCDLDGAGMLLNHLLGNLQSPVAPLRENLLSFDQSAFFDAHEESVSLADRGFIYIPDQCAEAECHLHLAFHGCDQNVATVGDDFVWDAGYNGWAEANRIVVLYPQTVRWTRALDPTGFTANPRGCWDWWGYSGDDFATREAPQMRAVRRMVEALGVPR